MPLFSIVMPTRNRSHLLKHALLSALDQTFDDYEIVVSDNHSSDQTAEIAQQFSDSRVHYFRTDKDLHMPDSWEFALSKARGKWVIFLSDDSAISLRLLKEVSMVVADRKCRVVVWPSAAYFHSTWYDSDHQNQIRLYPFTGHIIDVDSRSHLNEVFALRSNRYLPRMLNSCCSRQIINKVKEQIGRFFLPSCPDYTSGVATLGVVEKYAFIDIPFSLAGLAPESIGPSSSNFRGDSSLTFAKEFREEALFKHVPLHAFVVSNYVADSILRVKEAMPECLSEFQLDWKHYFIKCYLEMLHLAGQGVDISSEKEQFFRSLREYSSSFQTCVRARLVIAICEAAVRRAIRATIDRSTLLSYLEPMVRHRYRTIKGKDFGFTNILEAVKYLDVEITKVNRCL